MPKLKKQSALRRQIKVILICYALVSREKPGAGDFVDYENY